MKINKSILILLLLAAGIGSGCRKIKDPIKPEARNDDDRAGFSVFEVTPPGWWKGDWYNDYESDTFLGSARFIAHEEGEKFTWLIGSKTYISKEVQLDFTSSSPGTPIPVKLVIEKQPDRSLPNDNGIDTFIKNIVPVNWSSFLPGVNEFRTFQTDDPDNPGNKWEFTISREISDSFSGTPKFYLDNIPKGYKKEYSRSVIEMVAGYQYVVCYYNNDELSVTMSLKRKVDDLFDCRLEYYNYLTQSKEEAAKLNFEVTLK